MSLATLDEAPPRARPKDKRARPPRPTTPRRSGLIGDFVAIQIKSQAGISGKLKRVLWSAGLRGIGNSAFGWHSDAAWLGQLKKVQHLIQVIPLTSASGVALNRRKFPHLLRNEVVRMSIRNYSVENRRGRIISLENGEYIQCEQGKNRMGLVWTSALPFNTMLDKMLNVMDGKVAFKDGVAVVGDDDLIEGTGAYAMRRARKRMTDVTFFRLDSEEVAFSWRSDVGLSDSGSIRVHECSLVTALIDSDMNSSLVRELATEAIGTREADLLANLEELSAPYPHHALSASAVISEGDVAE